MRFLIQSGDRDRGVWPLGSNFRIMMPEFSFGTAIVRINRLTIPRAFRPVNDMNRYMIWSDSGGNPLIVPLPLGFYTPAEAASELTVLMTAASGLDTYSVTYNSVTKRMTFSETSGPSPWTWTMTDLNHPLNCRRMLGFSDNALGAAASFTSDGMWDGSGGIAQIYIGLTFPNANDEFITSDSRINDRIACAVGLEWEQSLMTWHANDMVNNVIELTTVQTISSLRLELEWRVNDRIYHVPLNDKEWSVELWLEETK